MKTFDKAKQTSKPRKKWWIIHRKKYSYYIWALPLIPFIELADYIEEKAYAKRVWNTTTATKVLDKVLPKVLEWVEDDKAFYYNMEWGYSQLWRKAPLKYRKWARKFQYDLHKFVETGYENAQYTKTVDKGEYYYDDTWVKFEEKII
jgi:hypothetical protein